MILITGSTGIVGTRLAFDLLRAGKAVRAMKRPDSDLTFVKRVFAFYDAAQGATFFEQIEWIDGDVLDIHSLELAMTGVSEVYHCAALVSYSGRDAEKLIQVNSDGTTNVVNAALEAGVKKLCHISSVATLGKNPDRSPSSERTAWRRSQNNSVYGLSKYLAEREVWRGTAEGLPAVIVNPSIILGPSKPMQSSGMLMALLQKGIPYYPGGTAGYVDVRDVSRMSIALMESAVVNEKFILNAENLPFRELLNLAANIFGNKPPQIAVKPWMLGLAWRALAFGSSFTGKVPRITKETARSATKKNAYNNEKVRTQLNTEFIPVSSSLSDLYVFFSGPY